VHVAAWVESLSRDFSSPTVKQWLAAVRMLFDWLVIGQVLAVNPAAAVRGPKYVVRVGKTPVLARLKRASCSTASTPKPSWDCAIAR
jgi:site-specific recombinase XerC